MAWRVCSVIPTFAMNIHMMQEQQIIDLLHEADLRITKSRKLVLDLLAQTGDQAISSNDIEQNLTGIDRITLYRILKTFEDSGLIHSVADGSGKTKYAMCSHDCSPSEHHHNHIHFHCRICDVTSCLDTVKLPSIGLPADYTMEELRFVVTGICSSCNTAS